jgi:hypothetical protein
MHDSHIMKTKDLQIVESLVATCNGEEANF